MGIRWLGVAHGALRPYVALSRVELGRPPGLRIRLRSADRAIGNFVLLVGCESGQDCWTTDQQLNVRALLRTSVAHLSGVLRIEVRRLSQNQWTRVVARLHATTGCSVGSAPAAAADPIVVTVLGRLDVTSLALVVAKAIITGRDAVVVELDGLDSFDPEDVGLLVHARSVLRSRGQQLVVRSPCTNEEVRAACALLDPFVEVGIPDRNEAENVSSSIG